MTVASKGSDSKYNRPGSGSRPNSSDSAAALDGSERIGPGKSGRHHNFDEDKSESMRRKSHDRDRGLDMEYSDDRGRERRERGRENRGGEDSDRGRDSSLKEVLGIGKITEYATIGVNCPARSNCLGTNAWSHQSW